MTDESVVLDEQTASAQAPLVAVTFQRNVHRKEKYLEAEPKVLGITQMGLSVFLITCISVFLAKDLSRVSTDIPLFISSLLVVVAGGVAVGAQNLHLPTLRACLGMQIVACCASIFNVICTLVNLDYMYYYCWHDYSDNATQHYGQICHWIENAKSHFYAGTLLINVTLLAISVTLAAYCCKVVNCCGPAAKMPVITVQTPAAQQ